MADIAKIVDKVTSIPTIPQVVAKMNQMLLNPKTSARDIAQLIGTDPALATKILQIVNSAFYGFPNRIASITHAIVILGFNTIRNIALSTSLLELFKGDNVPHFDLGEFWKHSLAVASGARVLARRMGLSMSEEFFIAGLVHDVGKIVENQYLRVEFSRVVDEAYARRILFYEAEKDVLGVTHAEIGKALFEKWKLPQILIDAAGLHHQPDLSDETYLSTAAVHVADILARSMMIGEPGDERLPVVNEGAWEKMGLKDLHLDDMLEEIYQDYEKASVFLALTDPASKTL